MDPRTEKAFDVANYMATLSNQRRIILEEFNQKLIYYINGATFKITPELINFTKTLMDMGQITDVSFIDFNNLPVLLSDVHKFYDDITAIYFESVNSYAAQYANMASKRNVEAIVAL